MIQVTSEHLKNTYTRSKFKKTNQKKIVIKSKPFKDRAIAETCKQG